MDVCVCMYVFGMQKSFILLSLIMWYGFLELNVESYSDNDSNGWYLVDDDDHHINDGFVKVLFL